MSDRVVIDGDMTLTSTIDGEWETNSAEATAVMYTPGRLSMFMSATIKQQQEVAHL